MSTTVFGKVQTNRALLNKYRERFKKNREGDESFLSPRPQPGKYQPYYFALLCFPAETENRSFFMSLKHKYSPLTKEEYEKERNSIEFFWEA
ncbi:MAG TPA: hypothetical protein VF088_11295 [Pyrinomonadaceae bacterium]